MDFLISYGVYAVYWLLTALYSTSHSPTLFNFDMQLREAGDLNQQPTN